MGNLAVNDVNHVNEPECNHIQKPSMFLSARFASLILSYLRLEELKMVRQLNKTLAKASWYFLRFRVTETLICQPRILQHLLKKARRLKFLQVKKCEIHLRADLQDLILHESEVVIMSKLFPRHLEICYKASAKLYEIPSVDFTRTEHLTLTNVIIEEKEVDLRSARFLKSVALVGFKAKLILLPPQRLEKLRLAYVTGLHGPIHAARVNIREAFIPDVTFHGFSQSLELCHLTCRSLTFESPLILKINDVKVSKSTFIPCPIHLMATLVYHLGGVRAPQAEINLSPCKELREVVITNCDFSSVTRSKPRNRFLKYFRSFQSNFQEIIEP